MSTCWRGVTGFMGTLLLNLSTHSGKVILKLSPVVFTFVFLANIFSIFPGFVRSIGTSISVFPFCDSITNAVVT